MGRPISKARRTLVVLVAAVAALLFAYSARPGERTTDRPGPGISTPVPPASAPSATSSLGTTISVGTTTTTSSSSAPAAAAQVDRLVVATPRLSLPYYRRAAFGDGWDYDPATGCNTRERVLIDESLTPPTLAGRCHPDRGSWRSSYDGVTTNDPRDLEIDHLVSLADAWRSGAAGWPDAQRVAFANDLADPNTLAAVTSHANRSKSDATPDQWLPPDRSAWCTYVGDWVEVKSRWKLSVTPAEKVTLVQVLSGC